MTADAMMKYRALAHALLDASASADGDAPSAEALEEAALGCAVMTLLSASEERLPTADKLAAILGVIVIITRAEGVTRERMQQILAEELNLLWDHEERVEAQRQGRR